MITTNQNLYNLSKWLCSYEIESYSEIKDFIDFELKTFDEWHLTIKEKENKLKKQQEEIIKKEHRNPYEEDILNSNINDFLSGKDELYIAFEQEVFQMLLIKIYLKFEISIKVLYTQTNDKPLTKDKFEDIKNAYKKNLSIDFTLLPNYIEIQKLRIFNNNFKHYGNTLSLRTTKEICKYDLLEILKDYLEDSKYKTFTQKYSQLQDKQDKEFAKELCLSMIKIDLTKQQIIDFYTIAYNFLKTIYMQLYP